MQYYFGLVAGTSKEDKPECPDGWSYCEVDTGIVYLKQGGKWIKDKENPFKKLFKTVQETSIAPEA